MSGKIAPDLAWTGPQTVYMELYKQPLQIMREKLAEEHDTVAIRLHADCNQDLRRYNLPAANDEVAAIIPGDGSEERSDHRDIILREA